MKHQILPTQEWGSKARKEEDELRGRNNADRRAAIAEQLDDEVAPEEQEFTCYWIVNILAYSAEDAAEAAEEAMDGRKFGSVWHVVPGIVAAPEGAIEIDVWDNEEDEEDDDVAGDGSVHEAPAAH